MLEVKNLKKEYDKKVLDDISINIDETGIYALVGPNGMGKTTFMDALCGLVKKDSGEVYINEIENTDPSIFEKLTYARNTEMLYQNLSALDHFRLVQKTQGASEEDLAKALNVFKVEDFMKKRIQSYSTGMKQKTLLTCSFIGDYDIYIMDEPVSGLDPAAIITLRNYLKELEDRGKVIIFSSHTLSEVDELTNEVIFIRDGRLIRKNIKDYKKNVYEISFENKELETLEVDQKDLAKTLVDLEKTGKEVKSLREKKRSTEDLYLEIYGS